MVKNYFQGIKVSGVAAAVSDQWVPIESCLSENFDTTEFNLAKFKKTTGIQGKYLCYEKQTSSDLCVRAAEEIIERKNLDRNKIGVVVYITQTPDYRGPSTACVMQYRLGLSEDCIAFDVNLGCSGFVYGINIISSILLSSDASYGLLLCGDISGQTLERKYVDIKGKFLFGDAGSAVLVEKTTEQVNPIKVYSATDGGGFKNIISVEGFRRHEANPQRDDMDGIEVFEFAVSKVPEMIKKYMTDLSRTPEDYDHLVLHQANLYMMKQIAKRTGFTSEKMAVSIDKYGNTSSVTIPITIVSEYGDITDSVKKKVLTCGFGIGLSWGVVELVIDTKEVYPIIHTNEWFDDGLD